MKNTLKNMLLQIADDIDSGNCNATDEELAEIFKMAIRARGQQELLTKEEARIYLGISRSTFDRRVQSGEIPPGLKRSGVKELFWSRGTLDGCR